ncbi:hypothetical protein CLTEP_17260 [Clostridium tepidiprofundi DSM 19306]|uniref:RDD family protein n=1 Tax=Clostridium tepidiprofundi DSM 19306 TaxID=1121338 RepID=A0A151B315_9CLOT|nr:hypothetical protein [Clostridium tepidiprofundi]KYH34301.1 hypothetical protein CLTEP_17260 [Clostridium tepidiprofundi DSM 19306]
MLEQKRKLGDNHLHEIEKLNERMEQLNKKNTNVKVEVKKRVRGNNRKNTLVKCLKYNMMKFLRVMLSNIIDFMLILAIYYPFRNTMKYYHFLSICIVYFCIFDGIIGWSVGKKILRLRVFDVKTIKEFNDHIKY